MPDFRALTESLLSWFRDRAKPALQKTEKPEQIVDYDRQAEALSQHIKQAEALFPICVLGQARVGKSTLINTLVAETDIVVPSGGGDGPLTANALRVRYGTEKRFTVRYHGRQVINQTRFTLEAKLRRDAGPEKVVASGAAAPDSTITEESELKDALKAFEQGTESDKKTATEEAIRRARLLVTGSQSAERTLTYLVDALAAIQGLKPKYGTVLEPADVERIESVKAAVELGSTKRSRTFTSTSSPDFQAQLRLHACEYLAPLIEDMQIEWPSDMLRDGVELVDLPGIGIHNDLYESVTSQFLREKAKAIMLVTDSGGLRKNDAELLRDSGFLNRLLHASDNPQADPVSLIVAVVKVDDVAEENWRNEKAQNGGTAIRKKAQHFADVVESLRRNTAKQLKDYLTEVWQSADDSLQRDKTAIIERLSGSVQVFPLSAPQYRLLKNLDEEEERRPFLPDVESTQVPSLRRAVVVLAQAGLREKEARLSEAAARFFGQLRARLNVAQAQLSDVSRAEHERAEMEQQLTVFLAPKRREFDHRRGAFRNYLRATVPELIAGKVGSAARVAEKEIHAYLRQLRDAHWATLRAAVRRSGTFVGARHIQLPHDFALCFEAPVAQVWSTAILQGIRKETANFADYQEEVLKEVLGWAKSSGIKVTTKLLEALVEDVLQQRQRLNAVGKEAVEELRAQVRKELIRRIEGPIRRRCEKFVADGDDIGPGVKSRILEMFSTLAAEVIDAATEPAINLLTQRFKEVEVEIVAAFKEHANPLVEAADALLQRFDRQLERDGAKATEALPSVTTALETIPVELSALETQPAVAA